MKRKKYWFKTVKIILIVYVAIGFLLYIFQEKLLFHPQAMAADEVYHFPNHFTETNIAYNSEVSFDIVKFTPDNDSAVKGVVLYFHGNMENIAHYQRFAQNFTKHHYEVWMMDYPGFGKSTGSLSENILYTEADEVYKMARVRFAKDSIIIYGKSIGTGIAAYLASERDCKRLILESPYYSITSLAQHYCFIYPVSWMIKYKIPTNEYFSHITAPITIFHGTDDWVVPYSNGKLLQPLLKKGDEYIPVNGGTHNNLNDFPLMKQKLDSLLSL